MLQRIQIKHFLVIASTNESRFLNHCNVTCLNCRFLPENDLFTPSFQECLQLYNRARYYDTSTGEFCSRDPREYVDGYSMSSSYMGLVNRDPFGLYKQTTLEELHETCTKYKKIYDEVVDDGLPAPEIADESRGNCERQIANLFYINKRFPIPFGGFLDSPLAKIWEQFGSDCPRPRIECVCCKSEKSHGWYIPTVDPPPPALGGVIQVCWNRFEGPNPSSILDLHNLLVHESTHAQQDCYYDRREGLCTLSLKWELEAYYCDGSCDDFSSCIRKAVKSSCLGWCDPKVFEDDRLLSQMQRWFDAASSGFCKFPRPLDYPVPGSPSVKPMR